MKTILKKSPCFGATATLCLAVFLAVSCEKKEQVSQGTNVSFTPCQQKILKNNSFSDKVDVAFTGKGVQITYYNFAVTCDFTAVDVTHTFVNGVLNITQQGAPNQANCICYTDVSYTIDGISQKEVNVIFINGVQVYCYNENYPIEIPFEEYSLAKTSCQWKQLSQEHCNYSNLFIINSNEELGNHIICVENGSYAAIDFSKYTLLLANGVRCSQDYLNYTGFQQISAQSYVMRVGFQISGAAALQEWQIAIIVDKLKEESCVELDGGNVIF